MKPVKKIDFTVKDYMVRPEVNTLTEHIQKYNSSLIDFSAQLNEVDEHIVTKTYDIYEVRNPYRNPETQYFAVDERDLLDNVLAITRAIFNSKERKAEERGFHEGKLTGYAQGVNETVSAIKKLPWYKRLFNYY